MSSVRWPWRDGGNRGRRNQDVNVSLLTGIGSKQEFIDSILDQFAPRIGGAAKFALESHVLLIQASNGVAIDVALAVFPYEERMIDRASDFEFADQVVLTTASAEDLVVIKAFAGRHQDWFDVEGIVVKQGSALDWDMILTELETLCKLTEDRSPLDQMDQIRRTATN